MKHIVSKAQLGFDSSIRFVNQKATDEELVQLSKSEHAVLRAIAISEMMERPTFIQEDVINNHLNDTAILVDDYGEFGTMFLTVSDAVLWRGTWKTYESRDKTIDYVIMDHNYLKSAYEVIDHGPTTGQILFKN